MFPSELTRSQVIVRPVLYVNDTPAPLGVLENVEFSLKSYDADNVKSQKDWSDVKLDNADTTDLTFQFSVPGTCVVDCLFSFRLVSFRYVHSTKGDLGHFLIIIFFFFLHLDNLRTLEFSLKAQVSVTSQNNQKTTLVQSQQFSVNQIDSSDQIEELHLQYDNNGYHLMLLGKTGEPRADR